MKVLDFQYEQFKNNLVDQDDRLVHFMMSSKGYLPIDPPKWSREITECPFCGGTEYFLWKVDKHNTAWGCGRVCLGSKLISHDQEYEGTVDKKRCLEWPLFCEINGIGDEYHDVRFEDIKQSQGKLDYMFKFACSPRGIILMRGDPGTGKTYACMGICELFTRKNQYCIFTTQKKMSNNWLLSQGDPMNNYVNSVMRTPLLVIDDFATGEPTQKFLEFLMELINTRLQWKGRGTIITTNVSVDKFGFFCGEALSDRIATGQIFNFEGKSRRKKIIL